MRKELDDYVRQSLDALTDDGVVDWEQFEELVGSLVDKVAAMCESNMDAQRTSRPVNPNQGWRWRQQRGNQSRTAPRQPQASGSSDAPPEDRQRGERGRQGGHHGARNRRNHAARQRYNGLEVQRLQRWFRRNRKRCVRGILEGENDRRCNIPVSDLQTFFMNESNRSEVDVDNPPDWLRDCLGEPRPNDGFEAMPISPGEVKAQLKRLPASSHQVPIGFHTKYGKPLTPRG